MNDLQWRETIYGIRCSGSDCESVEVESTDDDFGDDAEEVQYGRSCITPAIQCGPFYNQPALPVGSQCWCATPYGPSYGQVTTP